MSMTGRRKLELERERREGLRLNQVRQECERLAESANAMLREVRDPAVQQFAAGRLRESVEALRNLRKEIESAPDRTWVALMNVCTSIQEAIAEAEAEKREWSANQARAIAEARKVQAVLSAVQGEESEEAQRLGREALAQAEQGDLETARRTAEAAHAAGQKASQAALNESVRREVVKGLLTTLKEMGFVTVGPRIDTGIVILEGRLASGRRARFEIGVEGDMEFDLDGYEGRSCAQDMEKVETILRDRFGVRLGPPQVVWKNPDRIGSSARDMPGGGHMKR